MAKDFKIIPANAGAGKTYFLTETLADWLSSKEVRPQKVLAVTYTEAAAAELRERVRARLLSEGMVDETLLLDTAYISTIHGLGQRLLSENAFAFGGSPSPRLIEEAEADFLIRRALASSDAFSEIYADLARYGFSYKPQAGSAEDQFRSLVRKTIDQLRALGTSGQRLGIAAESVLELKDIYGAVEIDGSQIEETLHDAVCRLLDEFPQSLEQSHGSSAAAKKAFRANYDALSRARKCDDLSRNWKLWKELRALRLSVRGNPTPQGYDTLAQAVMVAAEGILRHPGPLADASRLLDIVVMGSQSIIDDYSVAKQKIGAVDYADMVSGAERLLRENPEVLSAVVGEVGCVVIDEFQDTNPVQFAFLWMLAQRAPKTILVGDAKQSIMGFQGADVRLTEALVTQNAEAVERLPKNWRSSSELVRFFNAFSKGLFGEEYHPVVASRSQEDIQFLEILSCPNTRGSRKDKARPYHNVAMRIDAMLSDCTLIVDPKNENLRPAIEEDIAVLCTSHAQMANYANALRALGIAVQMEQAGWHDSPVIQLARHAIAFAADPSDGYAALGWLTLGPTRMDVEIALQQLTEGTLCSSSALEPLRTLSAEASSQTTETFVAKVLNATALMAWCKDQPNCERLVADLLRLHQEAKIFSDLDCELLSAEGFFGKSPSVFLGWLLDRKDQAGANARPSPDSGTGKGVELVTWFSAKGREWPIVFVCQLDEKFAARAGEMKSDFSNFADLSNVLATARLSYFPKLDIKEKTEAFKDHHRPKDEMTARRQLYVAMTRARDRLVLEWPEASIGKTSAGEDRSFVDLFLEEADIEIQMSEMRVGTERFSIGQTIGVKVKPEIFDSPVEAAVETQRRFDASGAALPTPNTPWRQQPSGLEQEFETMKVEVEDFEIAKGVRGLEFESATERGTAAHLALRAFLQEPDIDPQRVSAASKIPLDKVVELQAYASELAAWLKNRGYERIHLELPLQFVASSGAEINAIVDCLAEGPDGYLILDHKTGAVAETGKRFAHYLQQLEAYAKLVGAIFQQKPVTKLAINWVDEGKVSLAAASAEAKTRSISF
ncbi:ATP-dependent helicase/nuclease subunit A [Shimia thalassica]|uniref:DNA 3'-5' helicase n=1 Tax=Shimia thalassica TaxID=1715693 RepID=A0A0N7M852_9RHOB|nr:UvrD-helicase domain-containing protein [Shimia thalassica]CUJ83656.1 ATP-dependent helicase/nuclease subunit A [Shimia thalassica]